MAKASPIGVAAAQVSGVVAAFAHLHRISEDEALAEIGEILAAVPKADRAEVLARATQGYLVPSHGGFWYDQAVELLQKTGVDMDRARVLAAKPRAGFVVR